MRLALVTRPAERDVLPYSARSLQGFEAEYCDDRFWDRSGESFSGDTRLLYRAGSRGGRPPRRLFLFRARDRDARTIPPPVLPAVPDRAFPQGGAALHVRRAGRSDESPRSGRHRIGAAIQTLDPAAMEIFLRFTHRYWFHEVSNQAIARSIYRRLTERLGTEALYEEVRAEVEDMNEYLEPTACAARPTRSSG